ncbi:hypothetical protein CLAFUW4_14797 [Fulvia fulva]|uniref:Uncharacterized protein n=1 Tax=Passalora fulva TaxID=5499 RepID=A0A9Q8PMN2_PASFU|nr:uncharacterized protein CLAFUR5_14622 [Fulvia fulva]KAK4608824.1 hypothetical protein CLAFUR4_14803 [Fulvia fulva]KAK4609824.1 hypothetical protein CLAFUR0_14789 [Fulvia fulva]UJO25235.1 hypothetical protein CLAFUR5_14622 [Fulvia fulva]WPV22924.1 hypothetical protein CLAFUW4_14797 [Fulvia fulva]WPV37817.1 hypothetical protein CLAFUW7_14798 [Fulvia fulva]
MGREIKVRCRNRNDVTSYERDKKGNYMFKNGVKMPHGCNHGTGAVCAHTLHPSYDNVDMYTICLCVSFFTRLDSTEARVATILNSRTMNYYDGRNANSMRTAKHSCTRCVINCTQDVVLYSEKEGKAYGPDRAKWLTASVRGGALIATVNVDCYVYYLVSKFMQDRFGEEVIGPVKF